MNTQVMASQLQVYRKQAAQILGQLVPNISSPTLTAQDTVVDDTLRSLSGQAPRPAGRQPYDGFFPNLSLPEQRRRAGAGIKVFLERLLTPQVVNQDFQVDRLIRVLRGFPPLATNQPPYVALFTPSSAFPPVSTVQLRQWRADAAKTLARLLPGITSSTLTSQDGLADNLLRSLSGQAPRPADRLPYEGFFPNLPLAEQRRRVAVGVAPFIERLAPNSYVSQDGLIDALIRSLRGLPPRPSDRPPYEGLFAPIDNRPPISPAQLSAWRTEAARWIAALVPRISGRSATPQDAAVDDLLRSLGGQAPRPIGQAPYAGFFPNLDITEQRRRAAQGASLFIERLSGSLTAKDETVDDTLRILRNLPPRPAGRRPYEGLFPALPTLPPGLEVTASQLQAIAPFGSPSQINKFVAPLNRTMAEFGINTRLRQAHFLAQLAHESGEFNFVEEIASGDAYEGRLDLGNTQPGDGRRFKGRGLIQITGRANYTDAARALRVDVVNNPTLLATDELAARSAGWFWQKSGLNAIADQDDVIGVTRVINGGTNGLSDRVQKLAAAKRAFGL